MYAVGDMLNIASVAKCVYQLCSFQNCYCSNVASKLEVDNDSPIAKHYVVRLQAN